MAPVLLLGDARLREISKPVESFASEDFRRAREALDETLAEFRRTHGFGRAISAPQIGVQQRFIAMALPGGPPLLANPIITWKSDDTFTMWDDCMSFPSLLVRVRRFSSISIRYQDERGDTHAWEKLDRATSELLQHEIDHLDGILAIDRAIDRDSLVLRETFEAMRDEMLKRVDGV